MQRFLLTSFLLTLLLLLFGAAQARDPKVKSEVAGGPLALEKRVSNLANQTLIEDTNAETICDSGEVLLGDGTCITLPSNTNAETTCGDGLVLLGDGTCKSYISVVGSCPEGQFVTGILANGTRVCAELDGSGGRTEPPEPPPLLCDTFDCAAEIANECADAATFATRVTCAHNVVRKFASPAPVVPLAPLTYEQGLVVIAQPWADGCVEGHNSGRLFEGSIPGENIAFFSDPSLIATTAAEMAVKLLAAEREFYDIATNTCEIGETCGHYTQLVWDDTNLLGCGIVTSCNAPFPVHVVCNYFPPGNLIGFAPYDLP